MLLEGAGDDAETSLLRAARLGSSGTDHGKVKIANLEFILGSPNALHFFSFLVYPKPRAPRTSALHSPWYPPVPCVILPIR